jgi:hypothetical protein
MGRRIVDQLVGEPVPSSPFCGLPPRDAKKIAAKRPALRIKPLGPTPNMGECLLHHILGRLFIAEKMPQEAEQAWRVLSIPGIERLGIAAHDLLPEFPVVEQLALQCVLRAQKQKGSIAAKNIRKRRIRARASDAGVPCSDFRRWGSGYLNPRFVEALFY